MDLIGIPDFISGAMENWGLITFRETSFLIDDSLSSVADKQRTALTVCHELAHQWFGDLVTMAWWNDLWLNEGFASFLEYGGVNHAFPEWQMNDQFVILDMLNAFDADSLPVTHAISVNITNPAQINSFFDSISYDKGAAILRMLSSYVDSFDPEAVSFIGCVSGCSEAGEGTDLSVCLTHLWFFWGFFLLLSTAFCFPIWPRALPQRSQVRQR